MKIIIMAAGKGTRLAKLGSTPMPKVLRRSNGRTLLDYVLDATAAVAPKEDTNIIVGYLAEQVENAYPDYHCIRQGDDAYGTGYAVMCGMKDASFDDYHGDVFIVNGDMPLFSRETLCGMKAQHEASGAVCTMLTCISDEYLPYGRIVRGSDGRIVDIVEEADCTPEQKLIKELNIGMYIFNADKLRYSLSKLTNNNAKGEYYITDLPPILIRAGEKVESYIIDRQDEIRGVNTPEDLEAVGEILKNRG
ncbi:MAG: NTP transferase domain-containing protein [Firmicutes bacterium]|nr:NTP transferase domain-containing protein [Bacillota bacterium]